MNKYRTGSGSDRAQVPKHTITRAIDPIATALGSVFVFGVFVLLCAHAAIAQSKDVPVLVQSRSPFGESLPTAKLITPALNVEDQLKIRDLQYGADKKALELQRLQLRIAELQEAIRADNELINDAVRNGARASGVDLNKYLFDLDVLKFIPRPAPAVNQPVKPLEAKPK